MTRREPRWGFLEGEKVVMHTRRTWFSFAAILAVLVGVFAASPGLAASSGSWADRHQFPSLPEFSTDEFTPAVTPLGANPNRLTTVMLKMAGDSVAEANFKSGRSFGESDKAQVRGDLQGRQDAIKGAIAANGATVLGQYQDAYNGIKVRASASSLKTLASLPNVVAVRAVQTHELDNAVSVPFIGTPKAWSGLAGVHGEGIKVAIIDTGIDYTHADFGGPGTVAAWNNAVSKSTLDPTLLSVCQTAAHAPCFGPNAPRVKGGVDLVGDSYNADPNSSTYQPVPHPDPNPLDCFGHGSHVAGTAAGSGVLSDGTTYSGAYNATTISSHTWNVGPGVAPKADLYAIRVFGCAGSTDVVVDALNWAVAHNMDVVNMSLGSSYGAPNDPDNEATNNAKQAGVIVVASAGNSGNSPYITGSPSIAEGAIAVAAADSSPTFPGAKLTLHPAGTTIDALNANGFNITTLTGLQTKVLPLTGTFSGCTDAEYTDSTGGSIVAGKLVVTVRGSCARVQRAILGAKYRAAAVAMINTSPGYPPFEGPIPTVDIPFLGIRQEDATALNGSTTVDVEATGIANPGFKKYASFTSAGPRRGDSMLKPDVTAPGVSIQSTGMGSGTGGVRMSGTSMAAPHVSGVAALAKQAHPGWDVGEVRAAIVNTATISPSTVAGYQVNLGGGGLVQPAAAVATSATATTDNEATGLSFGYNELTSNYSGSLQFQVTNHARTSVTFNTSVVGAAGSPHTLTVSAPRITIGPGDSENLSARLAVPAGTVGSANAFRQVSGAVVLTPTGGGNHGVALRLPYQMTPRARSNVATSIPASFSPRSPNATATITNVGGTRTGTADFYAWGLSGHDTGLGELGLRAVGVQTFPADGVMVFAVNTYGRFETPNVNEYDILIDTTGTGHPNYLLAAIDNGVLTTGSFDGSYVAFLCKLSNKKCTTGRILGGVYAPFNGSTLEIVVPISRLNLTAASPRFTYSAASFDVRGDRGYVGDEITDQAPFNAFNSAISTGQFDVIPVGATVTDAVSINSTEWAHTPALGLMIVVADNRSGGRQAQLVRVH
jgi:subtilisin family serine protease